MSIATIRISDNSRNVLREIAAREGASMQAVLDKAIEAYRRQLFLEEVNKAYAVLRQNHEAWSEVEKERALWDSTLSDGLEPNEEWSENDKLRRKAKKRRKVRG